MTMVPAYASLVQALSLFSDWNNCTAGASNLHAKPALALAHHKTGTYFMLAVGGVFCRGKCCRTLNAGDAVWPLRSVTRPELVLSVFGQQVQLQASETQHFRRIVHLVRPPQQVVTSALKYHASGHEDHKVTLMLERLTTDAPTWSVVAGIHHSTLGVLEYCTTETSSLDVVQLVRAGIGLLNRSSTARHAGLLRSLQAEQQLLFEAAWNWCELSHMLRIATQLCGQAHAVQLDISPRSAPHVRGAAGSVRSLNLTGLALQLISLGQSYSWVTEARAVLRSSVLSAHANSPHGNESLHERSAFAGHPERALARVYTQLEERYSALRVCTSWRQWLDEE